ncbi:hypothetical protein EMIHUDRAFT_227100 [Emiliania huxleyi CCMP1516]|uniref:Serpin domain-containing protein n=2 Tax=Emiliania huxleyi TaxID=2903 RepID=A0A0D3KJN1_EMIH1|nr:hypothetical protein EMIHUDRAFT_227100 [Emiliania huxleyi CCMP1516]EOD35966.1 hypothetical protein EMIHUDRAFT_227100 [Emiliania huxleyi CCMP1516]|eukprot:XP_005788395.1 hypothetical protein EMIHUDRAFT_227100 [Emiliania huxleyi CCMP1516]
MSPMRRSALAFRRHVSQLRYEVPGYGTATFDLKHEKAAGDREPVQAAERSFVERTAPRKEELTEEQKDARAAARRAKKARQKANKAEKAAAAAASEAERADYPHAQLRENPHRSLRTSQEHAVGTATDEEVEEEAAGAGPGCCDGGPELWAGATTLQDTEGWKELVKAGKILLFDEDRAVCPLAGQAARGSPGVGMMGMVFSASTTMFVARTPLLLGLLGIANVDAFASAPNTLEDMTARMVSGLIEDFAAVSANFGEDSVETVAKAVINSTPELNSYVLKIMSHMTGMEAWRTGVPPNDALISKFWDEDSWHVTETVKIDKITETIYNAVSPEATSYLYRNDDLTLVKEMIDFPTTSNSPEDVTFDLPTAVAYTGPSDLYYMPLTDLASLIQSKTVSCVTVVTAFKERLEEFDPYLAFVTTPLYDSALTTAAEYDELLAAGESKGPLMCIPFGRRAPPQIPEEPPL